MPAYWKPIQYGDQESLAQAREQMHQAIQIVAAIGRTYLPKVKDDHYANFKWNPERELLQGNVIEGDQNFSAALELKGLAIHLLNSSNQTVASFSLHGKTQKATLIWLEGELVKLGVEGSRLTVQLPYEIPVYPTSKGKEFNFFHEDPFIAISNYFSNTNLAVENVTSGVDGASEIRCWPHHFDIASLITLNDTGDAETSTSIGVGMSPGDGGYNEPYYYLTPWPYPPVDKLPELDGPGNWHTDGWVGAVLTGSALINETGPEEQMEVVENFFRQGVQSLKGLLSH